MNKRLINYRCCLSAGLMLVPLLAWTQDQEAPADEPRPSQEVEVSEDNYRAFMELKDQNAQRRALPFNPNQAPKTGLLSMDELPEESQKHLRNQLREIILTGDAWTPDSVETDHPYEPSAQARADSNLRQQESTAWEELVGEYHAREEALYARTSGQAGQPGQPGQAGQQGQAGDSSSQGESSAAGEMAQRPPGSENSPGQESSPVAQQSQAGTGVSESALDFLTAAQQGSSPGSPAQGDSQNESADNSQPPVNGTTQSALQSLSSQQGKASQANSEANEGTAGAAPVSDNESASESALGYLQGDQQGSTSNSGSDTNAEPTRDSGTSASTATAPGAESSQQTASENALEQLRESGNTSPANNGDTQNSQPDPDSRSSDTPATSPPDTGAQQSALQHLAGSSQPTPEDSTDASPAQVPTPVSTDDNQSLPSTTPEEGAEQSALQHLLQTGNENTPATGNESENTGLTESSDSSENSEGGEDSEAESNSQDGQEDEGDGEPG